MKFGGNWKSKAKRVVLWLILIYAGICGLVYIGQRRLIYPASHRLYDLPSGFEPWARDGQVIGYKRVQGADRGLFFLHGNGGNARGWAQATEAFPGDVFVLEYPGYGERPGHPTEASLKQAALEAFDAMPSYSYRVVCGQSLGTGVTPVLFQNRADQIHALILITPFSSLEEVAVGTFWFLPVRWLLKDRFELSAAWSEYPGPSLVVLAGQDEVIPAKASAPFGKARGDHGRVIVVPGAGHNDIHLEKQDWENACRQGGGKK